MNGTTASSSSLFSLLILIAVCGFALWLLKRNKRFQTQVPTPMRLRGQMAVGPRERVVLIEVSGQLIMVGVAPGQVRGLAQFPLPVEGTPASEGSVVMPSSDDDDVAAGNDFKRLLNQFQSRRKSGPDQSAP